MRPVHYLMVAAVAAIAAALGIGCGVKSAPIPPEYAKPARILDLEAINARDGVRLSWHRPDRLAGGGKMNDLGGFTIERAPRGEPFQEIATIAVTDQTRFQVQRVFNYRDAAASPGETYRYQIISETLDGYVSAPSNIVTIVRRKPAPPPSPENYVLPAPTPLP